MSQRGLHSRETTGEVSFQPEVTREAPEALISEPWNDDPELNISCRTKTILMVEPDIISAKAKAIVVTLPDFTLAVEINLTLNPNHVFKPGQAPRTCSTSVDDIVWLPGRSTNLNDVLFPDKVELAAQNKLRAQLKRQRLVDITFAFRLKYREGPATPRAAKKVVILATIRAGDDLVNLAKG
jgi:hypothetical protein